MTRAAWPARGTPTPSCSGRTAIVIATPGPRRGIRRHCWRAAQSDFVRALMDARLGGPVLCPHVHLPVQSGSSKVLAAMDRQYTRDEYMRRIEWIRGAKRQYAITTD